MYEVIDAELVPASVLNMAQEVVLVGFHLVVEVQVVVLAVSLVLDLLGRIILK